MVCKIGYALFTTLNISSKILLVDDLTDNVVKSYKKKQYLMSQCRLGGEVIFTSIRGLLFGLVKNS